MKTSTRCSTTWWPCGAPAASAIFLSLYVAPAHAEEPAVHIIGSRLPRAEVGVAQQARILTREDIARHSSLHEVLRPLPELHVDQPGTPAGFSSLYLRGADPNHTVYLIDGVKVNDPSNTRGGGFDFGGLDPNGVERIEILPGASSGLYGADAMAGVVSIVTRRPRGSGLRLGGGAGGFGYRNLNASLDGKALRADAAVTEDGGEQDLGFKRIRTLALRMPRLSLRAWQHESEAFPEDSGGPMFAVLREHERRDTTSVLAAGETETTVAGATLRLRAGALSQEQDFFSPGVAPGLRDPAGLPRTVSSTHFDRWNAALTAEFDAALVGAEYQREDGDTESTLFFGPFPVPASFALDRDTRSLFAEARTDPGRAFSAQAGVRVDHVQGYSARTSVQAGLRYRIAAGPTLALNLGTGFKPPSFFALGNPLVGNPALRPEESETAELSLASREEARTRHRVAVFRADYSDLVDFDPGPPPRLVNRSQVTIKGLQYSLSALLAHGVRVSAGASWFSYDLPEGADPLRSRPRSKLTATAHAPLAPGLSLKVSAARVGRVRDSSIPTGPRMLDPYLVVDGGLAYARGKLEAALAVDNLFNGSYQQFIGFPAVGRRVRAQLSVGF